MKALIKTLFGDVWNIAGVAVIVALAACLTELGLKDWAVFAMPLTALCVIAILARH